MSSRASDYRDGYGNLKFPDDDESLVSGLVEQEEAPDYDWATPTYRHKANPITEDPIVNTVIEKMTSRSKEGMVKYGCTMARTDISIVKWVDNTIEELLDAAVYLERMRVDVVKLIGLTANPSVLSDVTNLSGPTPWSQVLKER